MNRFGIGNFILGMRVDETSIDHSVSLIEGWVEKSAVAYVCVSNVHMCMETFDDPEFRALVNGADLVVPDGKPLAIGLKLLGSATAKQVRGADLTKELLRLADTREMTIGLYGGTEKAVKNFVSYIRRGYPSARIGCAISPPFRALDDLEDEAYAREINGAGVQILFIGLGCPKQEKWMAAHKGRVNAVMVGVGAVFDFLSGEKREAPRWMRSVGLEWLFRLMSEPKRLWRRYLILNPRFLWHFGKQLMFGDRG